MDTEFHIGMTVILLDPPLNGYKDELKWKGLTCEVIETERGMEDIFLRPLSPRPDGHELAPFYWSVKNCKLIPSIDRVELINSYEI